MAWNETKMTVVGWVCTEITTRTTTDGSPMASFTVKSVARRYDANAGTWSDESRLFVQVRCYRRLAQNVGALLSKDDPVVVIGRASTREYETNGTLREALTIDATCIGPDLSLCEVDLRRAERTEQRAEVVAA